MSDPIRIAVVTHHIMSYNENDIPVCSLDSVKIIDHANGADRKWLGTHCFWAMRNGRKVTTYPVQN